MSQYDERIFGRITELISLLSDPSGEMTVARISEITGTTPEQTREDLLQLHHCGISLSPAAVIEKFHRYESRYDTTPIQLTAEIPGCPELGVGMLFLTPMERSLFERRGMGQVKIKDTPSSISMDVAERAKKIEEAIAGGSRIRFRYKRAGAATADTIEITPRYLYFNATDDLYYCIAFGDTDLISFRLDRMQFGVHLTGSADERTDPVDPRLERLRYAWGAAFTSEEPPQHVRIRIETNTANILGKIRSDLTARAHASLYEEDGYYIYEDDIIGLNSFRSWLMTFGSSVKVLEPKSLAEELLRSSEKRLNNYETGRFSRYDD